MRGGGWPKSWKRAFYQNLHRRFFRGFCTSEKFYVSPPWNDIFPSKIDTPLTPPLASFFGLPFFVIFWHFLIFCNFVFFINLWNMFFRLFCLSVPGEGLLSDFWVLTFFHNDKFFEMFVICCLDTDTQFFDFMTFLKALWFWHLDFLTRAIITGLQTLFLISYFSFLMFIKLSRMLIAWKCLMRR